MSDFLILKLRIRLLNDVDLSVKEWVPDWHLMSQNIEGSAELLIFMIEAVVWYSR